MAFYENTWYVNSVGYAAVTARPQNAAVAAGVVRRQFTAPAVGSERCFVCIVAGTTANTTDATWTTTRGAKTTDGTATWQEVTGLPAVNGDLTNTVTWTQAKAVGTPTLGAIIQRNNGASYWICSTAGTMGASEPAWANNTAGTTQADGTTTWTCLGVVGNFSAGGAPHARLANPFNLNASTLLPNTIYVGDNHAESQATAITITPPISVSVLSRVLCHNHSGSYPPAASDITTGATVDTTAAVSISIGSNGQAYFYGIAFRAGVGLNSAGAASIFPTGLSGSIFDNCSFQLANAGIGSGVLSVSSLVTLNNTPIKWAHANGSINLNAGNIVWRNTSPGLMSGSSVPTNLFSLNNIGAFVDMLVEAVDLSAVNTTLINFANPMAVSLTFKDCKLNASVAPISASGSVRAAWSVQFIRCDSGANAYTSSRYCGEGVETTETSVTRVGGAQDANGQAQSRKIVTTAIPTWPLPYKAESYAIWNPTTGANVTVTVFGTVADDVVPNNDDLWMEVEFLSATSSPLGKIVTTNKANILSASAAVSADSSAWSNATYSSLDSGTINGAALSNNDLTATSTGGTNQGVRGRTGRVTGKYYFEVSLGSVPWTSSNAAIGLIPSNVTFAQAQTGAGNGITAITQAGGGLFSNNTNLGGAFSTLNPNDVIGIAVDLGARLAWIRVNGSNWNNDSAANPATGANGMTMTGGIDFAPMILFGGFGTVGQSANANFGATSFVYASPFSYGSWPPYTMFKLETTLSSPQPGLAGFLEARVRAAKPSTTYYIDPRPVLS